MRMIVQDVTIAVASLLLAGTLPLSEAVAQSTPTTGQTDVASSGEVRAQVAAMISEMKPEQGFMWRPVVRDGARVAAIEVWKKPGRPAVHPTEAEYAIILEGAGTLVSGGTLTAPVTRQDGLVEGTEIEGGTKRTLGPGDVLLVPAGVPHWFGITGDRLVLLGTKLPVSR